MKDFVHRVVNCDHLSLPIWGCLKEIFCLYSKEAYNSVKEKDENFAS